MGNELQSFIGNAESYWTDMKTGGAAAANRRLRKQSKLVAQWVNEGVALENLKRLLSDDSPRVKLSAAANLINCGGRDEAIATLLSLTKDPYGLVAPSAAAILRIHKIHASIVDVD